MWTYLDPDAAAMAVLVGVLGLRVLALAQLAVVARRRRLVRQGDGQPCGSPVVLATVRRPPAGNGQPRSPASSTRMEDPVMAQNPADLVPQWTSEDEQNLADRINRYAANPEDDQPAQLTSTPCAWVGAPVFVLAPLLRSGRGDVVVTPVEPRLDAEVAVGQILEIDGRRWMLVAKRGAMLGLVG